MEQDTQTIEQTDTTVSTNTSGADESKVEGEVVTTGDVQTETNPDNTNKPETKKDIMIPKDRFDEVNNAKNTLASELETIKQELEELKKPKKEEPKQEMEPTKEEPVVSNPAITQLESKVQQYETLLEGMVTSKLSDVPEEYHELIPEGLSAEQKLSWINKAVEKGLFKKEEPKQVVVGQPLNHSSEQSKAESMKRMNPIQLLASYYGEKK